MKKRFMILTFLTTTIVYHAHAKDEHTNKFVHSEQTAPAQARSKQAKPEQAKYAVCVVPVADLVGDPFMQAPAAGTRSVEEKYLALPAAFNADSPQSYQCCPRVHQLLFNETVEVIETKGEEVLVRLPNIFYQTAGTTQPKNDFWTLKKNITSLRDIRARTKTAQTLQAIPQPLSQKACDSALCNTVALIQPYYDPTTKTSYVAGTRFVLASDDQTGNTYQVLVLDPRTYYTKTITVPTTHARTFDTSKTIPARIKDFVTIAHQWAHQPTGAIPYVWGGCSSTATTHPYRIEADGITTVYRNANNGNEMGLDCSGLVARAAQLAGIPYFYKNTLTAARNLSPLSPQEHVTAGDLIWIPGHIMIVSNVHKGLLVEARHYRDGYGYVHEIPLNEEFKNINTYDQLVHALTAHTPLARLNKDGRVTSIIPEFKILKLSSVVPAP